MITLESDRLQIEMVPPGDALNHRCRFDRAGFIARITLDKKHDFCAAEPDGLWHPSTQGRGLCSEYRSSNVLRGIKAGDLFPKFGVGLCRMPDNAPYQYYRDYALNPFPVKIEQGQNSVTFKTGAIPCNGYALQTKKTISVNENIISMEIEALNVGEKEIDIREYCHNFVSIDGLPIGPDYRLGFTGIAPQDGKHSFLSDGKGTTPGGTMRGRGSAVCFSAYDPGAAEYGIKEILPQGPYGWKLTHAKSSASVSETVSFKPASINIWAVDTIISPEVVQKCILPPGERTFWAREWTFDA